MKTRNLVPMMYVLDLERSIAFYRHLGFEVGNSFTPEGESKPSWAWLQSGDAQLMLAPSCDPIIASRQGVMFYVYTDDVEAARASLVEAGHYASSIATPFYAPRGEFQLDDPDGYVIMVTHT